MAVIAQPPREQKGDADGPRFLGDLYKWMKQATNSLNARIYEGEGSPEGVVTASAPALYLRTDGGAGTTLYVKESGTGNTGWSAK